jgi:hypothetical protein
MLQREMAFLRWEIALGALAAVALVAFARAPADSAVPDVSVVTVPYTVPPPVQVATTAEAPPIVAYPIPVQEPALVTLPPLHCRGCRGEMLAACRKLAASLAADDVYQYRSVENPGQQNATKGYEGYIVDGIFDLDSQKWTVRRVVTRQPPDGMPVVVDAQTCQPR